MQGVDQQEMAETNSNTTIHDAKADERTHPTPVVSGDRCVHGRSPIANCRACVSVCPRMAFSLDDDGLGFDVEACDGCGLCEAVCPETAIDMEAHVARPLRQASAGDRAFLACEYCIGPTQAARVTCLHAVSLSTLVKLHNQGVRTLFSASADCSACPRNVMTTLRDRVADLARLTQDRGLAPMKLEALALTDWKNVRDEAGRMSRRSLFRAAFKSSRPAVDCHPDAPSADGAGTFDHPQTSEDDPPPGAAAQLAQRDKATLSMMVPLLDPQVCVACGACIEVCAHGVIKLTGIDERAPRYEVDAIGCTGCGLCADSCDVDAIALQAWGAASPAPILLHHGRCRSCSSPFFTVADHATGTDLCRICAQKNGNNKLFQVLP